MSRGLRRGLWILVALIVVVVFAITARNRLRQEEVESIASVQAAEGIPVNVVTAQAIPVEDWRGFVGVAQGEEQVDLTADLRTRVEAVHVAVGDLIRAGEVLLSLDSYNPMRAAINFESARTQYETARTDSARTEELFKSGAISQQDLDHARAAAQAARALYLTARRAVELDTPITGLVTAVNVEPGDYADAGQTLATVAAYDRLQIPLELSGAERAQIEVGQPVRLLPPGDDASGGRADPLRGEVVKVALSADPETRLFRVEVLVANPGHRVRPGELVALEIRVATTREQPVVPAIALLQRNGEALLYVVVEVDGQPRVESRLVTRGVDNEALVAIPDGIAVGDPVVVWGQNHLRDGVRVKIHRDLTDDYFPPQR